MGKVSGEKGVQAETIALNYLTSKGLQILKQNFRCRRGEIDLIMKDSTTCSKLEQAPELVFIEVRYRSRDDYGSALESVTQYKVRRIIHTATYFQMKFREFEAWPCRFDIVTISPGSQVDWLQSAFTLS